ncbi:MAG: efflux RND transporter periplasmic adaptor subunit [Methylococcaceae bacterium]|nr:efflux RND transporter periplasmic adaptor subunit [Methylococcaceae bacterium]
MLLLKISLPIVLMALGTGGAWWLIAHKTEVDEAKIKKVKHEPPTVAVATAKRETLRLDVISQGVVAPKVEIDVVAEVSGKVVKAHPGFAPGGHFRKGEMLVMIDPRDYEFAVTRANAAVAEAYKELLREREEALQAESEWQALGSGKATEYVLHKPQLKEREAKLAAAESDWAAAKLQVERCRLIAPFDGWVRDKRVLAGQYLSAGEKVAKIYADASAEVRLPIASDQLEFLELSALSSNSQNGPEVRFTAHFGGKERIWDGRIVRTTSSLDDKNALLYAVAEIPNAFKALDNQIALMPGQFVRASIAGIERFDLLSLPKSALFGGNQVYSIDQQDKLKLHRIQILRTENDRIIISEGVASGERIVVGGMELPIAGMKVKTADAGVAPKSVSTAELTPSR